MGYVMYCPGRFYSRPDVRDKSVRSIFRLLGIYVLSLSCESDVLSQQSWIYENARKCTARMKEAIRLKLAENIEFSVLAGRYLGLGNFVPFLNFTLDKSFIMHLIL
ncbi:hypothetical protein CDAR_34021 [Caerostris darwini]|uniref:Uncharacterized protein n=1 Tax=Caerostris darwini TaxID=1538125 RepID=A0AAV4S2P1_9ARAC|nr:hypothetical protein CDAR_34021 [Caerostris darwini]